MSSSWWSSSQSPGAARRAGRGRGLSATSFHQNIDMVWSREGEAERPPLSVILPRLYLGAERDVTQERLASLGISYVLSVSRCSPRPSFLPGSRFLRIPIDDSLWDDLLPWIPQALHFIDAAMSSGAAVLVHCAAGISRSPALAVAYIMYSLGMDLDHAYRFVKERRPSISPNFNFLGQLQHFQGTLSSKQSTAELLPQPPPPQPLTARLQSPAPPQSPAPLDDLLQSDDGQQRLLPGGRKQQQPPSGSSSLLDRRKSLTLSLTPLGGHTPPPHSPALSHSIHQSEAGGTPQALTPTGVSTHAPAHTKPGPAHSMPGTAHSTRSPAHSEVKQQSLLSPLSFTLNKLLDWGERLLLGGALIHPVRMGQSALSYRC